MKHPPRPGLDVSRETSDRLAAFVDILLRWNRAINLISRRDEDQVWTRHVQDSLELVPAIPPHTTRAIDLGSGAGFPGLILAIATDIPFDLIEADHRKAAFLREAARQTKAPVTIHAARIDATTLAAAPLLTARALAPLSALLDWSEHLRLPHAHCLFPKGRTAEDELTQAKAEWQMRIERFPSRTDPSATLLRLSEIARVRPNP